MSSERKKALAWEQQPDESAQAFAAFKLYRDAGAARSVDGAYRASKGLQESNKRAPGRWREWADKFDWANRAEMFDDHLAEIERKAAEQKATEQGERLAERRAALKESEFELHQALITKAKLMLDFPLAVQIAEEKKDPKTGNVIKQTIIKPGRWSFRDVVRMFEMASKLGRLALDLKPAGGAAGEFDGDDDGNVAWSVKLPPDIDEDTWLTVYAPQVKKATRKAAEFKDETDKVM